MEEVKKTQNVSIEYRQGIDEIFTNVRGYQVGGGVLAVTLEDHTTLITPLDTIKSVVIYNKE